MSVENGANFKIFSKHLQTLNICKTWMRARGAQFWAMAHYFYFYVNRGQNGRTYGGMTNNLAERFAAHARAPQPGKWLGSRWTNERSFSKLCTIEAALLEEAVVATQEWAKDPELEVFRGGPFPGKGMYKREKAEVARMIACLSKSEEALREKLREIQAQATPPPGMKGYWEHLKMVCFHCGRPGHQRGAAVCPVVVAAAAAADERRMREECALLLKRERYESLKRKAAEEALSEEAAKKRRMEDEIRSLEQEQKRREAEELQRERDWERERAILAKMQQEV